MALIIEAPTGQDAYVEVLDRLRRSGRRRPSRNGLTHALEDVTIALDSPLHALPIDCGRNLNLKIAAAEALQLIGGFSDPDWLVNLAPQFKRYREPTGEFYGAYGERIGDQVAAVVSKLRADRYTRQAVITLWNPLRDNDPDKLDYPCTVALGFSLSGAHYREADRLDMRVTMRSNDAWLGLPYDMFQFTQLQLTICNVLGYEPGTYTHTAWSMHLYYENANASYAVTEPPDFGHRALPIVHGIGVGTSMNQARARARLIAHGELETIQPLTDSEGWYYRALHG